MTLPMPRAGMTMVTPHAGMTVPMPRAGMTLVELLVAMMVLLVGIYAVAKGFPSLFQLVQADADRTSMSRLAEGTLAMLRANADRVPDSIYGYAGASLGPILPDSQPTDPDEVDPTLNPANSRDDIIQVVGERFYVPAPYNNPGGSTDLTVAVPLMMGLARTDPNSGSGGGSESADVSVYQLVPLIRTNEAPAPGANTAAGTFYIDPTTGVIALPSQASVMPNQPLVAVTTTPWAVLSYAFEGSDSHIYYVSGERLQHGSPVTATTLTSGITFGGLMVDQCRAWLVVPFTFGDATGSDPGIGYASGNPQPAAGSFYVESNYGATLLFNPADQGRELCVDYSLRTGWPGNVPVGGRRELMVSEDRQAPATNQGPPYTVTLSVGGVDSENPLLDEDFGGNPLDKPVHILAIDLTDGQSYSDADGTLTLDYVNGIVTIPTGSGCLGHVCRFYYRTLDQHSLQVTSAPSTFIPKLIANAYADKTSVNYRWYDIAWPTGANTTTTLNFPSSSVGQTVSVDYTWGGDPNATPPVLPQRVTGELHVVADGTFQIALNNPNVKDIIAVRGVSVKVRGWWRAQRGKLRYVDVDSCLVPAYPATIR
jgi:prepilin-type N-terminal cleavage/methylation domain-containing protein